MKYNNSGEFDIPDSIMELAYRGYILSYPQTNQSLDRIKERGGFSIQEILNFIAKWES